NATSNDVSILLALAAPSLSIAKTHSGNFTQDQQGATYTITVSNAPNVAPTYLPVTVTESLPSGLTLVSMAGTGWTCANLATTCTSSDPLAAGASYPPLTVTVNVGGHTSSPQVNQATVTGGGSQSASTSDSTNIVQIPRFGITKTHSGNFTKGQQGVTYTIT